MFQDMRKDNKTFNLSNICRIVLDLKAELSRRSQNLPPLHLQTQTPKYLVKSFTNHLLHLVVDTNKINLSQLQQT